MAEEVDLEKLYWESSYCWPVAQMSGSTELAMGEAVDVVSVVTGVGRKKESGI